MERADDDCSQADTHVMHANKNNQGSRLWSGKLILAQAKFRWDVTASVQACKRICRGVLHMHAGWAPITPNLAICFRESLIIHAHTTEQYKYIQVYNLCIIISVIQKCDIPTPVVDNMLGLLNHQRQDRSWPQYFDSEYSVVTWRNTSKQISRTEINKVVQWQIQWQEK